MHWTKPLGLLGVAVLAVLTLGALFSFVTKTLSDVPAIATIVLLVVAIAGLAHVGGRSKRWRQNPYW
jgi:peptidoglycan/LPS O-acetylase OafA/YrhL